jgi:hypothetical protein
VILYLSLSQRSADPEAPSAAESASLGLGLSEGAPEIGNPSEPAKHGLPMEAHSWLYSDLERRRIDSRLRGIAEVMD